MPSKKKQNSDDAGKRADSEENEEVKATTSKPRQSRSDRAGVVFPVGRIEKSLKKGNYAKRIGNGASIYLAGVLDYLVSEITDLAGQAATDDKKKRILPRHITKAIKRDEEIDKLLSNVIIASGGVLPRIHPELVSHPKTKPSTSKGVKKKSEPMQTDQNEEWTNNNTEKITKQKRNTKQSNSKIILNVEFYFFKKFFKKKIKSLYSKCYFI